MKYSTTLKIKNINRVVIMFICDVLIILASLCFARALRENSLEGVGIKMLMQSKREVIIMVLAVCTVLGFSHCYLAKVSSQKVNFSLLCAADGAAFGKTAEHPGVVEIAQDMTLWVRGRLKVDGESWQELDTVDSGEIWESGYVHGQKGVSGCFYRREQGGRICAVFNRAIRWGGSPITVNADPIPEEDCPDTPVSALCPAENGFVLATVGTDGYITVDLAWSAGSTAQHNWIDGSIQYWKEES